jgi:hypothetical protein
MNVPVELAGPGTATGDVMPSDVPSMMTSNTSPTSPGPETSIDTDLPLGAINRISPSTSPPPSGSFGEARLGVIPSGAAALGLACKTPSLTTLAAVTLDATQALPPATRVRPTIMAIAPAALPTFSDCGTERQNYQDNIQLFVNCGCVAAARLQARV